MEAEIRKPKMVKVQCKGCRRVVTPAHWTLGMAFGECCKDKMPNRFQFNEFVNENLGSDCYNLALDGDDPNKKKHGNFGQALV